MKPPINDEPLPAELAVLLESLCLGELSPLQAARIEELVGERPENCQHYVRFIQMHAFAERYEGADPAREEEQLSEFLVSAARPKWSKPMGRSRKLGLYGAAAASALAVCYYGAFALLAWNLRPGQLSTALQTGEAVARIAAAEEAQWTTPASGLGNDAAVPQSEPLRIESGSVEMTLLSGVRVVVRGPAEWLVDGANRATLRSGQMTAEVPAQAVGFTLMTPAAQIIDLGTEFQVDVTEQGATEVQVLRGLVHVRPAASTTAATSSATPRRLSDGEGIRVLPGSGEMVAISATGDLTTSAPRQATRTFKTRLIDLSKSGIAIQSSGFSDTAYPPAHAIDGNPDTFSHTAFDDRAPWWQVDLGNSREIVAAVILNRKGTGNSRLRNIRVQILADDGRTVVGASPLLNPGNKAWGGVRAIHQGPTELVFDFARDTGTPVVGRYLRIERQSFEEDRVDDDHGMPVLTLAEVQVFEAVSTR